MAARSTKSMIRVGVTKVVLTHRSTLSDADRTRLEDELGTEFIADIDRLFNTTLLPLEKHIRVVDVLDELLGAAGVQDYFASAYVDGFTRSPMLRSLIDGTLRLFGPSPASLAKAFPRAWRTLAQHTGEFQITADAARQTAEIHCAEIPVLICPTGSWVATFAGTFEGFIRQCGNEGVVDTHSVDVNAGRASYRLRWS